MKLREITGDLLPVSQIFGPMDRATTYQVTIPREAAQHGDVRDSYQFADDVHRRNNSLLTYCHNDTCLETEPNEWDSVAPMTEEGEVNGIRAKS